MRINQKPNKPVKSCLIAMASIAFSFFTFLCGCSKDGGSGNQPTKPVAPKADFSFTVANAGLLPATVNFTNITTNASSYSWAFGDGQSSSAQNPANTYANAGTYTVKLIVTGAGGTDSISKTVTITQNKPKAGFTYIITDNGNYPTHVTFNNTSTGAMTYSWTFDNGHNSTQPNPIDSFSVPKTYNVKLVATNAAGSDSVIVPVTITINVPSGTIGYNVLNPANLPLNVAFTSNMKAAVTYYWDFGDGTYANTPTATHTYTAGGIYNVTLTTVNPGGSQIGTLQVIVSPYPVTYVNFNGTSLNLYAWEGKRVAILSRNRNLNPVTMFKWATTMDSVYGYYKACTGQDPGIAKILNGRTTIADVPATCGAGCGYLGATGIELQNTYFDAMYNGINNNNQFDQANFYEFGRNFWFYGNQLAYKTKDPVTTGYAVLMRFMSLKAAGVQGGPFNGNMSYSAFESSVASLVDQYVANASLNWSNTLGVDAGVPGGFGGAADLFASFCMRLKRDYGGDAFMLNIWKQAGKRPIANTTQDAVDNFILAACAAANKNLTNLFINTWRWPMSATAQTTAAQYP